MAYHTDDAKYKAELNSIVQDINKGFRVLIILRGLPGSGKSTLGQNIIKATVGYGQYTHVLSTDDYFSINGSYKYDVAKLSDAHIWNQKRANQYLSQGISPIIIDNTNCEAWEMRPYASYGVSNGYIIKILEPKNTWSFNPSKLAHMNCHGVGFNKIKKMMEKYQSNITADSLLKQFDIKYPSQYNSPILRAAPPLPLPPVKNQTPKHGQNATPKIIDYFQVTTPTIPMTESKNENIVGIKTPSRSNNMTKGSEIDLIDLTDDWVMTETVHTKVTDSKNMQECIILDDLDDSWEEPWSEEKKNCKPKSQRVSNKNLLMSSIEKPNSFSSVNWEPIDVSLSNWDNCQSLDVLSISQKKTIEVENREVATNTSSLDANDNFKVLSGRNRNINSSNVSLPYTPKAKSTLDKGVMTVEENINSEIDEQSRVESMNHLKALFIDVPEDYMLDMLNKCNGDLNWTVEILLDAKTESDFTDLSEFSPKHENTISVAETHEETEECDKKATKNTTKNDSKIFKVAKKDKNVSEQSVELKKQIEENFKFSDDHYSDHSLKLKRKIRGECSSHMEYIEEEESTQDRSNSESSDEPENMVSFRMGREFFTQLDKIYGMDIAWDDKLEPIIHIPESLVNQIHALWLESVCNQIDVYKENMKVMIKEDEELARELEAKEKQQQGKEPMVGNLLDIMEMEMAFANYNSNVSQWEQSPEDLATKLTRQKLSQMFPEIDEEILLDVYKAHNNNFEQTFQILLLNTGKISPSQTEGIDQKAVKKLLAEMEKELLERANREKEKDLIPDIFNDCDALTVTNNDGTETYIDNKTAVEYLRKQAQHQLSIRNEIMDKAREYMNKGMFPAALYYSHIASLHGKKYDQANNLAASRLLQFSTSSTDSYTLDLHHLFVVEALQVLDIFLDKHIYQLIESESNTYVTKLFLITGRGRHSPGGQARIKPAVKKRLAERGIPFSQINPGLLGVSVTARTAISTANTDN